MKGTSLRSWMMGRMLALGNTCGVFLVVCSSALAIGHERPELEKRVDSTAVKLQRRFLLHRLVVFDVLLGCSSHKGPRHRQGWRVA